MPKRDEIIVNAAKVQEKGYDRTTYYWVAVVILLTMIIVIEIWCCSEIYKWVGITIFIFIWIVIIYWIVKTDQDNRKEDEEAAKIH